LFAAVVIASIALLDGSMDRALRRTFKSTSNLNDEDTEEISGECGERREEDIGKRTNPICSAFAGEIYSRLSRTLPLFCGDGNQGWLCIALHDAVSPTGEGSAA
jgi:hypothetical protein